MPERPHVRRDVVVIASSAGGVSTLQRLLGRIPRDFPGTILIAQHRHPYHPSQLAAVLGTGTPHLVHEPADRERLATGHVYLAPRDLHMTVEDGHLRTLCGPREHFTRPAADPLFRSAAAAYGPRVVGVVLSGGGSDGMSGLIAIKKAGGVTLAQSPTDALAPSMPKHAIDGDDVDAVLAIEALGDRIAELVCRTPVA